MRDWLSPEDLSRAGLVPLADVHAAIRARTLRAVTTHPAAVGQWRIPLRDAEAWLRSIDPGWPANGLVDVLR